MEWVPADGGDQRQLSFEGIPDGEWYPIDAPGVDHTRMSHPDDATLITEAKSDDQIISRASRVLSDNHETMAITQAGTTPDGSDYANKSVYRRVTDQDQLKRCIILGFSLSVLQCSVR
jgi:hypothetical protein